MLPYWAFLNARDNMIYIMIDDVMNMTLILANIESDIIDANSMNKRSGKNFNK